MFIGLCQSSLDKERQVTFPPQYLQAVRDGAYLTMGFDRNLLFLTRASFEAILGHIRSLSITDPTARLFGRLFLSNAVELSLNEKEQVIIPDTLLKFAGIEKEIVIIGQGDYCEMWAPGYWEQQAGILSDHKTNPDRFSKLNIALV